MRGKFLLDTNIVIALFAGEATTVKHMGRARAVFVPAVVIGELLYGAFKSAHVRENVTRVEEFAAANTILACDLETARHYGQIKDQLRRKGRPPPENDLWIAALARQHRLTLVSRDTHFHEMERLPVKVW
jgi:tRNA(fMet)-specific endonuclease VapC